MNPDPHNWYLVPDSIGQVLWTDGEDGPDGGDDRADPLQAGPGAGQAGHHEEGEDAEDETIHRFRRR